MRVYINQAFQLHREYYLNSDIGNYALQVLRLKNGDRFTIFNGAEPLGEFEAEILNLNKKNLHVRINSFTRVNHESPLKISLLQGISRGDRMDYTIQKAVELGISEIIPLILERTQVKFNDQKRTVNKIKHWQGICNHALQQSGRTRHICIGQPEPISSIASFNADLKLLPDPAAVMNLSSLQHQITQPASIALLIGPEGGFSDNERKYAVQQNFIPVRLGPRILRTETAGLAIISYLQTLWGDY